MAPEGASRADLVAAAEILLKGLPHGRKLRLTCACDRERHFYSDVHGFLSRVRDASRSSRPDALFEWLSDTAASGETGILR